MIIILPVLLIGAFFLACGAAVIVLYAIIRVGVPLAMFAAVVMILATISHAILAPAPVPAPVAHVMTDEETWQAALPDDDENPQQPEISLVAAK